MSGTKIKHTFRLPPALSRQLAETASRKRASQASIVEAALEAFLSPEGPQRLDGAFGRRLDRMSRQIDRLGYHVEIGNEAFALYVRRWLTVVPPPGEATAAHQAEAEGRFAQFIDALARRMDSSCHLPQDIARSIGEETE